MDAVRPEDNDRPADDGSAREAEPTSGFAGLFNGAVDGVTGTDVPAALRRACVDLMDVTGASVSLAGEDADTRTPCGGRATRWRGGWPKPITPWVTDRA
ncbi:hypothetical protein ACF059_12575 [Streptomyces sp. NPDC016562]|uniref:hypothetical protein n=1 Tax=Streptomyces sp. NPDC016562 TaxID=3364966 RepID=UPI0037034731